MPTPKPSPQPWTVLSRRTLIADPWLRLHAERIRTGSGAEIEPWYVVEAADWVTMVPVLPDGRIILVEQYRHGLGRVCRELPAGNIDAGEDPLLAAVRELHEETGYRAASAPIALGSLYPEPARSRVSATGFLIHCSAEQGEQALDPAEDIAVVAVTPEELFGPTNGGLVHGCQIAFVHLARRFLTAG
jgi:8-oxo-dGTP pyrophosphatase MutT (NUDIX family)